MNIDNEMTYAPIAVFAFNRLGALTNTIASLKENPEARLSDLYVFVDGPRAEKAGEADKVKQVRRFVETIEGFASLTYHFSDTNKGLANSIICGVTEVVNKHGSVIVLEDDLEVMPNFLNYINQGLMHYRDNKDIVSICGHSCKVRVPKNYGYDAYLFTRSSSWGWATWSDRWNAIDWILDDWSKVEANKESFKSSQGSDVYKMLNDWRKGKNNSWAIRFCYNQYVNRQLCVVPNKSLVNNNGFDGDGTNCRKYSRFKFELNTSKDHQDFRFPPVSVINRKIYKQAIWYHSLPLRIWSRIMYIVKG